MRERSNATAVSNEQIIAALLQSGTIREAAQAVNISPRAIYDRMKEDREFRGMYAQAKTDLMRQAVFSISGRLSEAITAVADIMNDPETNAAVRLQAAQTIINNATKFSKWLQEDESHARTEAAGPFDVEAW